MIYAVANQKGGVGKTTTVSTLGAAFAERGASVLIVDLDPQAGLTISLGIDPDSLQKTMYQVFLEKETLSGVLRSTSVEHLHIAPANLDLAGTEVELIGEIAWDRTLKDALQELSGYDMILLDCPPTLGVLTTNALVACETVIVPVQCEYLAFRALGQLLKIVEKVKRKANPALRVKILRTMYDPRTSHAREVFDELVTTWPEEVLQTFIKRTVKFADASVGGSSLLQYDEKSEAAESYRHLSQELSRGKETSVNQRAGRKRLSRR
jgi:chromosome partitioning protein